MESVQNAVSFTVYWKIDWLWKDDSDCSGYEQRSSVNSIDLAWDSISVLRPLRFERHSKEKVEI